MKLLRLVGATTLLSLGACGYGSLHATYGMMYNEMFAAQQAERSAREPWPMRGTEAKRIVSAYYDSFAPDDGGGGAAVGPSSSSSSSHSSSSNAQNPFSTKPLSR